MKNKELDGLEQEWNAISRMPEEGAGSKEAQKKEILARCGISTLSPEGYNLSEPQLDEKFVNYLQTQRAKNHSERMYKIAICAAIAAVLSALAAWVAVLTG